MKKFLGWIGVRKNGNLYCYDNAIPDFWENVKIISDYIKAMENKNNDEKYKSALLAVERFESWDRNINVYDHTHKVAESTLNDILKPAFDYINEHMLEDELWKLLQKTK